MVDEFRLLRDRVSPEPFAVVRRTIEEDLGRTLAEVFTSFDRTPIASASIAQVHAATLRTGERVVVKVQRSRVAPMVRLDIAAMAWIAPFLVGRIPVSALTNPPALVELFAETIVEELDFRLEAQNMLDIAEVFAGTGQRSVVVPRPHPELVTRRVLVMEHIHGFSWGDAEGDARRPVSTPPPSCGPASSPSSRVPSCTGCSTGTSTAATCWCSPTAPWPSSTSASPPGWTSASARPSCVSRWGRAPTT